MSLPRTAADVLRNHVTWELESIDRMYLIGSAAHQISPRCTYHSS